MTMSFISLIGEEKKRKTIFAVVEYSFVTFLLCFDVILLMRLLCNETEIVIATFILYLICCQKQKNKS